MKQTRNKQYVTDSRVSSLISSVLAALLLFSLVFLGTQTVAWFKNHKTIDDPAILTNFEPTVHYSFNGTNFEEFTAGTPIKITPDDFKDGKTLQLHVSYTGESAAFVRVMVSGSFKNEYTGTYLPQPENFWSLSGDNWVTEGEYTYFTQLLEKSDDSTTMEKVESKLLNVLYVSTDLSKLGKISEHQKYSGELYVIVDAVQPDRYDEIWGITTIPTAATTAAETATTTVTN